MKLSVKRWSSVPHGGKWWFVYPDTGHTITGRNHDDIMAEAKAHANANNLPIGLLFEDQVEDWICQAMPNACVDCDDGKPIRVPHLTMGDVERGTKVALRHWMNNRELVSEEEANRRAVVCVKCPYNRSFAKPCGGLCGFLKDVVRSLIGAKGTKHDGKLHACGICHCWLASAIWVPLNIQCPDVTSEMKELFHKLSNCWKRCD